jgi:hypothetical protein
MSLLMSAAMIVHQQLAERLNEGLQSNVFVCRFVIGKMEELMKTLSIAVFWVTLAIAAPAGMAQTEVVFVPDDVYGRVPETPPCVVVVQEQPGGSEKTHPCGEPVEVPAGEAVLWLEKGGWMTPFATRTRDVLALRSPRVELPLTPAGLVVLDADVSVAPGERVEVRHYNYTVLPSPTGHSIPKGFPPLIRSVTRDQPVLMPGRDATIALRYSRSGELMAVTRTFRTSRGSVTPIRPVPPKGGANLLLEYEWTEGPPDRHLRVVLGDGQEKAPAAVKLDGDMGGIAVWYGVSARDAEIEVESERWYLDSQPVRLEEGRATALHVELRKRPALELTVSLAADVDVETEIGELKLLVRPVRDRTVLKEAQVRLGETTRLERLPPVVLDLVLEVGGTEAYQRTDLTSGEDGTVHFELDPIVVHGTVRHGSDRVRANVFFGNAEIATDDRGEYEITLWQPSMYPVRVVAPGVNDARPFMTHFRIRDDQRIDLTIPRNEYIVRVSDAVSGTPLPEVRVGYMNHFLNSDGLPPGREPRAGGTGGGVETDEAGLAHLPPFRPGTVTIGVRAEGYREWLREKLPVVESDEPQLIEVPLERDESGQPVRLLLPSGAPAAEASVRAMSGIGGAPRWGARAGADGVVSVPREMVGSVLVVVHPGAGVIARRWEPDADPEPVWMMPPPAPPLTVRFHRSDGKPARNANVVIWIDGIPVSGGVASTMSQSDGEGLWVARNLPAQPLRIIGISRWSQLRPDSPAIEPLAEIVPYPWPPQPVLTVIE